MYITDGKIIRSEMNKNAMGGTELMAERILKNVSKEALEPFQIFFSRKTADFLDGKLPILYCHDLCLDPAAKGILENEGWKDWHKIIFVSHWQRESYMLLYGIPHSKTMVIPNFIDPIEYTQEKTGPIKLAYWSTPHRGLHILYPIFKFLKEERGKDIELKVFSSFKLYGWEDRDQQFMQLFDALKEDPDVEYEEVLPNEEIRDRIKGYDILAYPSVWPETSCLVLMEAMSAGLTCVHSDLGGLPETSKGLTFMYPFTEKEDDHAKRFAAILETAIDVCRDPTMLPRQDLQKTMADFSYSTNSVARIWEGWLSQSENRRKDPITYTVG